MNLHRLCALALLAPAAWLCAHADTDPANESTTAKFQATYNWQKHPGFQSPPLAAANNSLRPTAERMHTFTATAHWGWKVWENGEIYFNPEVAIGVPFSGDVIGLGAFTNGEITRAAGPNPTLYRQRLFLRQTWHQGGGSERQDADFNQFAGTLDRDRTVLTVGNLSVLDIFDDNAYAKDPRTQFMNWGHWTYAAYDYAADARGFAWGAAVEVYRGDWAYRFGRFTGPAVPNGLPLDLQIGRHYGDQFEVEHSHRLAGRPGKLRLLAWRNRAVLASFDDATAYLNAHPGADPQTILQVRTGEKTKYGLGLNVEQELGDGVGAFLRAMKADGRTETWAFTEADSSLSGGVLIDGSRWGRASDTVGLAVSSNGLSPARRNYLASGGLSFFIGDGANNFSYRRENAFESFYSVGLLRGTWLTLDWQRILNPAYNSLRGPVDVYALRLHTEF